MGQNGFFLNEKTKNDFLKWKPMDVTEEWFFKLKNPWMWQKNDFLNENPMFVTEEWFLKVKNPWVGETEWMKF